MRIDLISINQRVPAWVEAGFQDYAQRLPMLCRLQVIEVPLRKRGKNVDIERLRQQEGQQMLAAIAPQSYVVALDERGVGWSSVGLAEQLARWQAEYSVVSLLVGSPEGLTVECRQRAQVCWSLSPLTLPHPLVRVVVAEQIYRAWSILNHHPYHRG